ncbi:hypothetical protein [uncultured Pseudokineococcus sp.]|uniref:hypothetical protein n=1 Tax=uncultured Pseudokineococcus sp. TaxID=1642928 RepID=UPI00262F230F|nr:hypothetical protein [uncultured Pseudokineococcus sp.]
MPLLRPAPDRLGPDGQPLPVPSAPGHPEASADVLAAGVVLVGVAVAVGVTAWIVSAPLRLFLLLLLMTLAGIVLLALGVHRLASGADQVLRQRLGSAPSGADAASPWEPAAADEHP